MTIKKLSVVILSLVMIFSVLSVAASAAVTTIEPYTNVSVTASESNNPVFKFVPEETKFYILTSYATGDVDPYAMIETEDETIIIDDTPDGDVNFSEKLEFAAGVEYYITILTYSDDNATFDIALECNHEWDEDSCVDCGEVCTHETEGTKFKTCACGTVSACEVIELGDTENVVADASFRVVRKFVPEEDVLAVLYSDVGIYDVRGIIYDADGDIVAENDDYGDSLNCVLWAEFTAGETYYIEIVSYYEELEFTISLVKAAHTVDGEEHNLIATEAYEGNCQESGYTEGLYCEECDEYLAGHFDEGYGFCEDMDEDFNCDYCGGNMNYDADDEEDNNGSVSGLGAIADFFKELKEAILIIFIKFMSFFINY